MNSAYVYAIKVDGIVRYIGKGSGRRVRAHLKIVRSMVRRRAAGETVVPESKFYDKLCRAYLAGSEIDGVLIRDGLSHADAFREEIAEKARYPASQLWNAGSCWERAEYREKQRARWADKELRELHRTNVARAARSADMVRLQSMRMTSAWSDPASRERIYGGLRRYRDAAFKETLMGAILEFVRENPGQSFTAIRSELKRRGVPNALRKLRDRSLITKSDGRNGLYYPSNIIELERTAS